MHPQAGWLGPPAAPAPNGVPAYPQPSGPQYPNVGGGLAPSYPPGPPAHSSSGHYPALPTDGSPAAYPGTQPPPADAQPQQPGLYHQGSSFGSFNSMHSTSSGGAPHQQSLGHNGSMHFAPPTGPCYDITLHIDRATKLPSLDWFDWKVDPYIVVKFVLPTGQQLHYRTETVMRDNAPVYNETVHVFSLPAGTRIDFQVTDKELLAKDRLVAHCDYKLEPQQAQGEVTPALALTRNKNECGQLHIKVGWLLSSSPTTPYMGGPVRYRQHMSPLAGALLGSWQDDTSLQFCTYKLYLLNIEDTFLGVACPWNRAYDKARQIFESGMLSGTITTQHRTLYATSVGANRGGTVSTPDELFALLKYGRRAGQLRYFTYTLLKDSMRFSETGAAFMADMFSKHAMHAACSPEVLMAGEFFLCPDPTAPGGHRFVIDNNSGTYAPPSVLLPRVGLLMQRNFPGMVVEIVAADDPKLKQYHAMVPSRQNVPA